MGIALLQGCELSDPYRQLPALERRLYLDPTAPAATLAFNRVVEGYDASCMLTADDHAWCWGRNEHGLLGAATSQHCSGGTMPCTWQPVAMHPSLRFAALSVGLVHACGIDRSNQTWCWGFGKGGQLGDGLRTDSPAPVRVAGGHDFAMIDAGRDSMLSCALDRAGLAWCWGPAQGAGGNGSTGNSDVPAQVLSPQALSWVGAGSDFACGLDAAGQAWCWGHNASGQLGLGQPGAALLPQPVVDGHVFTQLVVGGWHVCGLEAAGQAWCWGFAGSLGRADALAHSDRPVAVDGSHVFTRLTAGYQHTCGLTSDGRAWCWGPMGGLLGAGREDTPTSPVPVSTGPAFAALAAGGIATCGLTTSAQPLCWGSNVHGAVGTPNVDP